MPCLCTTGDPAPCRPALPAVLLPDPAVTEQTLMSEAVRGWTTWASLFRDFDDGSSPPQCALTAARDWSAARIADAG